MSHETLSNHYNLNFQLWYFRKIPLDELNSMYPYEREIYVALLLQQLEKEETERKNK